MRLLLFSLLLVPASTSLAQAAPKPPCDIPAGARPAVQRFTQLALTSARNAESEYSRGQLLEPIASFQVCLGDFQQAARTADLAYPAGSQAQTQLGHAVVAQGDLAEIPALANLSSHGSDSFLYGVSEELADEGKFADADRSAAQIPAPEVREGAVQNIIVALYKAGRTAEALAREKAIYEHLPAAEKQHETLTGADLNIAMKAQDWPEVRKAIAGLAAGPERRYRSSALAAEEAEAAQPNAHEDLLTAAQNFDSKRDPPYLGYLIASHLASLHDFPAAEQSAAALYDDEWNQKAWTTIAVFEAQNGDIAAARASIARIGRGTLIHKLGMDEQGRDMARGRVAEALTLQEHPTEALKLLDEAEAHDDIGDEMLRQRVFAMANDSDIPRARSLVESAIASSPIVDEHLQDLAGTFAGVWYRKSPKDAEAWVAAQKSNQLRASLWIELAASASGQAPKSSPYFVNWD